MKLHCKEHDQYMHEILQGNKIVPYCATCVAEHRLKQRREQQLQQNRFFSLNNIGKDIDGIFAFLIMIPVGLFIMGVIMFLPAFLVFSTILFVLEWSGFPKVAEWLSQNGGLYYTDGIFVIIMILNTLCSRQKENIQISTIEYINSTVLTEKDQMQSTILYHQKKVDNFKFQLHNDYLNKTSNVIKLDTYNGIAFESFMASYFERTGYKVKRTPSSGDDGVDLIIMHNGITIGVQCKRYTGNVSVSAIQEVYAGSAMHDCNEAMVITTSYFTDPAKRMAAKLNVLLWDRDILVSKLAETQETSEWDEYVKQFYDLSKVNQVSL